MKHEWRKKEKQLYIPKNKPELINVPGFCFFTIQGQGNPNGDYFPEYIGVLYTLSYAVKMSHKNGVSPNGYFDYTVYPLEGVWDLTEDAKKKYKGTVNKDELLFKLMIRQPNFVDQEFAMQILEYTKKNKPHELLTKVSFEEIVDGECIQMLHQGSYDSEPESFRTMEAYAENNNYVRSAKTHREIYLNDARKTPPEKLKTVLRLQVKKSLI